MNADGTGQTNLTNNAADDRTAAWSPDGRRIAFGSLRDLFDEIWVMNADGTDQTNLTNYPDDDVSADWQPVLATPTQSPRPKLGDTDCDGDADSVDSLMLLRDTAKLPHSAACIAEGDVDCDGDVDSVDALFILRHVAALPVSLPPGCGPIGE